MRNFDERENQEVAKGIILASGVCPGFRPATPYMRRGRSQLNGKPMVYYPLYTLLLAGVRNILLICKAGEIRDFMELLGNGARLGLRICYAEQPEVNGLAPCLVAAERFIGADSVCLIREDTIYLGDVRLLQRAARIREGAILFTQRSTVAEREPSLVKTSERHRDRSVRFRSSAVCRFGKEAGLSDPQGAQEYPHIEFDEDAGALTLCEATTACAEDRETAGLCFFDNKIVEVARSLHTGHRLAGAGASGWAAARGLAAGRFDLPEPTLILSRKSRAWEGDGEVEGLPASSFSPDPAVESCCRPRHHTTIVDIVREYSLRGELRVHRLPPGTVRLNLSADATLQDAIHRIAAIEKREGIKVGCIEEAAFRMGSIGPERLERLARGLPAGSYREHLMRMAKRRSVNSAQGDGSAPR